MGWWIGGLVGGMRGMRGRKRKRGGGSEEEEARKRKRGNEGDGCGGEVCLWSKVMEYEVWIMEYVRTKVRL